MSTKAIKRKREDGPLARDWQPIAEHAPSVLRADQAGLSRYIGMIALLPTLVGGLAVVLTLYGTPRLIGMGTGLFLLTLGVMGLIFHAFNERDAAYRRIYMLLGLLGVLAAGLFSVVPVGGVTGGGFMWFGAPTACVALCFLFAAIRREEEPSIQNLLLSYVGAAGAAALAGGLVASLFVENYLLDRGLVLLLLALFYLGTYIASQPLSSERGYWAALGLGFVGGLMILLAVLRILWPASFSFIKWGISQPGQPFLFIYFGVEYLILAVGVCSESKLVCLTRRELASLFFSPIGWVVAALMSLVWGFFFLQFIGQIDRASQPMGPGGAGGIPEPIVAYYILGWGPIICFILIVTVLTMRLLSEEKRSGTLEMLLTAPVNELPIVLSKYLAVLRYFLLLWVPMFLYLVALRVEGRAEFDYRPVLSFLLVLLATGSGFLAMGLFYSSLSRYMIVAALLTFLTLVVLLFLYFLKHSVRDMSPGLSEILTYLSYVDLWINGVTGIVTPRYLFFHVSTTVFFLFLSVKVLEARKWS